MHTTVNANGLRPEPVRPGVYRITTEGLDAHSWRVAWVQELRPWPSADPLPFAFARVASAGHSGEYVITPNMRLEHLSDDIIGFYLCHNEDVMHSRLRKLTLISSLAKDWLNNNALLAITAVLLMEDGLPTEEAWALAFKRHFASAYEA